MHDMESKRCTWKGDDGDTIWEVFACREEGKTLSGDSTHDLESKRFYFKEMVENRFRRHILAGRRIRSSGGWLHDLESKRCTWKGDDGDSIWEVFTCI